MKGHERKWKENPFVFPSFCFNLTVVCFCFLSSPFVSVSISFPFTFISFSIHFHSFPFISFRLFSLASTEPSPHGMAPEAPEKKMAPEAPRNKKSRMTCFRTQAVYDLRKHACRSLVISFVDPWALGPGPCARACGPA